ncbi:MAG TPA: LysR substrate-binding domain-containing protein [Burkholderiaceae bacterium]|nr:LysR substrate-binding domain-containing protein [Burkholderiaceae bacterium]
MPTDPKTLRLFVAAAESGSISEAAKRCHVALAAASRRIATLEDRARLTLLTRHARGVRPTAAGLAFLQHARAVLGALDRLEAELGDFRRGIKGVVSVAANASAIAQFLPVEIAAFLREHPGLRIDLQERSSNEAARHAADGSTDIAVFEAGTPFDGLETIPYREDRLAVVVSDRHALRRRRRVDEAELFEHEHILMREGTALHRQLAEIAEQGGFVLRSRMQVGSFDAVCRMVEQDIGIAVLPLGAIEPQRQALRIRCVELDAPWALRRHVLGARRLDSLGVPARALLEHLLRTAGE